MTVRLSSCVQGMREKNTDSISNEEILVKHMKMRSKDSKVRGIGNLLRQMRQIHGSKVGTKSASCQNLKFTAWDTQGG